MQKKNHTFYFIVHNVMYNYTKCDHISGTLAFHFGNINATVQNC